MYVNSSLQSVLAQHNKLSAPKTGYTAEFAVEMEVAIEVAEATATEPEGE